MELPGRNRFQSGTQMTMDSLGEVFTRWVSVLESFNGVEGWIMGYFELKGLES